MRAVCVTCVTTQIVISLMLNRLSLSLTKFSGGAHFRIFAPWRQVVTLCPYTGNLHHEALGHRKAVAAHKSGLDFGLGVVVVALVCHINDQVAPVSNEIETVSRFNSRFGKFISV